MELHLRATKCQLTQAITPHLNPSQTGQYSIYLPVPQSDERLSWPRWIVTYQDNLPVYKQSRTQKVTKPSIEQFCW